MNASKLLHLLLVALLCYGQVVVGVHAVEHLELAECEDEHNASHHLHTQSDELATLLTTDHRHAPHPDSDNHSDNHSEFNCKIYHAFQNLSGIGAAFLQTLPETRTATTCCLYKALQARSQFLANPQIRAPPVVSSPPRQQ